MRLITPVGWVSGAGVPDDGGGEVLVTPPISDRTTLVEALDIGGGMPDFFRASDMLDAMRLNVFRRKSAVERVFD